MSTTTSNFGLLVARVLLGLLFVTAGTGKLADVQGFAGYMVSGGVPAILAWPAILFEIIAGVLLIVGFLTRPAAFALAVFSVIAGALYHYVPADQGQMTHLLKNLALAGGYIALGLTGAGAWSIDARTGFGRSGATA